MKLMSFRIVNCFGFKDSTLKGINSPSNLIFILGKNSSGKSTLLNAISELRSNKNLDETSNFKNFNPNENEPKLCGKFSIQSEDKNTFNISDDLKRIFKKKGIKEEQINSSQNLLNFITKISSLYMDLFNKAKKNKTIFLERNSENTYILYEEENYEELNSRKEKANSFIKSIINKDGAITIERQNFKIQLDFYKIEKLVINKFPKIYKFDENFNLGEDLPDRIDKKLVNSELNFLETLFIEYLNKGKILKLLASNDPDEREIIIKDFNKKIKTLCDQIYQKQKERLIEFDLSTMDGIQITTHTNEKKSFYRHLSENTKFLFAYFLIKKVKNIKDDILLFDEPNKGFHPSAQEFLLNFIKLLASENNQILLTTHSEYMIDLDLLPYIKIMCSDNEKNLYIQNHCYQRGGGGDPLSLQPIYDAIGLKFGKYLSIKNKMIIIEGITDYLYLKAFNKYFSDGTEFNFVPARGNSHLPTIIAFFIGQNISFKILIDKGDLISKIKREFLIDDKYIWEVPIPSQFSSNFKNSGIEDLFAKNDFKYLLDKFNIPINEQEFQSVPNSQYMRTHGKKKRILAHQFFESFGKGNYNFEEETINNFKNAFSFCKSNDWYTI